MLAKIQISSSYVHLSGKFGNWFIKPEHPKHFSDDFQTCLSLLHATPAF